MEDRGAVSTCNRPSSTVKPSDHRWIVWRHGRSEWLLVRVRVRGKGKGKGKGKG